MIIRRSEQPLADRYPGVPRYALANDELGQKSLHVGDLTFLPESSVPYHIHNPGAEETQFMLDGELECWIDGKRAIVRGGDTVTAPSGIPHSFINRTDAPARMVTAFPMTPPDTTHVDEPELEDITDHPAIIRAGTRSHSLPGVDSIVRHELSGDFSGAESTYTYMLEFQPGASIPEREYDHELAVFVFAGQLSGTFGGDADTSVNTDDVAVFAPGDPVAVSNDGHEIAHAVFVHPVLTLAP